MHNELFFHYFYEDSALLLSFFALLIYGSHVHFSATLLTYAELDLVFDIFTIREIIEIVISINKLSQITIVKRAYWTLRTTTILNVLTLIVTIQEEIINVLVASLDEIKKDATFVFLINVLYLDISTHLNKKIHLAIRERESDECCSSNCQLRTKCFSFWQCEYCFS